jgi:hypothetical protein
MALSYDQIHRDLKGFLAAAYPDILIRVEGWKENPSRTAIFFTEAKFKDLYPLQRYHYISHLIPADYQEKELENSVWFELAPGEDPASLSFPDDELIREITPIVMRCLNGSGFFQALDDAFCPSLSEAPRQCCYGDYRAAKPLLLQKGFRDEELFDVFHVLMRRGGYCDCEILYNVVETSRFRAEYWHNRAGGTAPHGRTGPSDPPVPAG